MSVFHFRKQRDVKNRVILPHSVADFGLRHSRRFAIYAQIIFETDLFGVVIQNAIDLFYGRENAASFVQTFPPICPDIFGIVRSIESAAV